MSNVSANSKDDCPKNCELYYNKLPNKLTGLKMYKLPNG